MMNNFQKSLIKNKDCAWQIVKLFHLDISEDLKDKLYMDYRYDWVCISLNKIVNIAVEFECKLFSGNKPLYMFEEQIKNNEFNAWRFVNDSKYSNEEKGKYNVELNKILKQHNIEKPTAKQMSDYYHSD